MTPTRRSFIRSGGLALAGTAGLILADTNARAAAPSAMEASSEAAGGQPPMRIIGVEEHFATSVINQVSAGVPIGQRDDSPILPLKAELTSRLLDLGEERVRQMDVVGLDMMVLSLNSPATQSMVPADAVPLARQANDRLAAAVRVHPDRFAGFATLPTPDPRAAVQELERSVRDLGFCGALIHGRTGARYLDHPDFRPLLAKAAALDVPIYLHPQIAPRAVREFYYDGFDPAVSLSFASSGWGWHADAGVGALRLILSGVFDEIPDLQIILGHWGENVMFFLDRADKVLSAADKKLKKPVADYFRHNFYVTPGGIFSPAYLQSAVAVMGIDRVMFASDYPFVSEPDGLARGFLENAPLSFDEKQKIAHLNAERLLKIPSRRSAPGSKPGATPAEAIK